MKFSNRAYRYLDRLERDNNCISTERTDIAEYFRKQRIPVFQKVLDFQIDYSGLALTIFNKSSSTFEARLFSKSDILTNTEIDFVRVDERFYFYCGDHNTAQFWFVLSQEGEICTYNNNDETVNVIFSSFEKFIERYALEDILSRNEKYEHPPYFELIDPIGLDNLAKKFILHITTNDNYNIWRSNEHITINQGKWFDRPTSFIHLYADNKVNCEAFLQQLKEHKIIG